MTPDCSIIVRSPAEAVALTPYVIGFHPSDSLVVLGLDGKLVVVGVRYDLSGFAEASLEVARIIAQQSVPEVVVLGYGPPGLVTPAVAGLSVALAPTGVRVRDALRVTDGRWWSYTCSDPSCCPSDGTPCRSDLAAEAVYRGLVALPSRKALVAQVAPADGAARREMTTATERARARLTDLTGEDVEAARGGRWIRRAGRQAIREAERLARAGTALSPDAVAWLGVLLVEPVVLDYALDRSGPDDWRVRLWGAVVRLVEPPYVSAPACLLGFAAWRSGDGALARVAVDRALRENPAHGTAGVLDRVLSAGISPHALIALSPPAPEKPRIRGTGGEQRTDGGRRSDRGRRTDGGRRIRRGAHRRSL